MQNIGTYFEIPVDDLDRAIAFYSQLLEYNFSRDAIHGNEMAFFSFDPEARGISGALAKGETYKPSISGTLIYLSTGNLDETLKKAIEAGATILFPKTEVSGYGWVAEIKDCEGNRIGFFQRT